MTVVSAGEIQPRLLRCATVLNVEEHACVVWAAGNVLSVRFAPVFPSPRIERVCPGHLVASRLRQTGGMVVWRWSTQVCSARRLGTRFGCGIRPP